LIVLGGVVRVTGAGLGCGNDWPVCNGQVVPHFTLLTALEYAHRVAAATVTLLTAALVVAGWRLRRHDRRLLAIPALALVLVIAQAGLGAVTVFLDLPALVVTAHLGLAESYLATLIVLAGVAFSRPAAPLARRPAPPAISALVAGAAVALVLLSGAYTAATNASYACWRWPTCGGGRLVPTGWTPADIQLLHRWLVIVAGLAIGALLIRVRHAPRVSRRAVVLASAAGTLFVAEVLLGALVIWLHFPAGVRAAHLGVATLIWGLIVALVVNEQVSQSGEERRAAGTVDRALDARVGAS
ncbi:MAG TPA: COX15/CtaA family protein, partial [Nitrolancea sp.]|nr:COX15/CtaA family protein [Nitrolancea sp.]